MIDFHNHFVGTLPSAASQRWPFLADRGALERSLDGVDTRVMSTPLEFAPQVPVQRINDAMADLVRAQPGRLCGLATVDGYAGEPAAGELERAIKGLGLRGVFIESASGELLPNAPQAQPAFAAAAALGVPVFLHPVPDPGLRKRLGNEKLVRGTINAAAILAMIGSGMFEEHRGLRVVVTALALGGLLLAERIPDGVYVDTTGMKPAMLRGAVELLGSHRVVAGTDWPIVQEPSVAASLDAILQRVGIGVEDRQRISSGNARELLRI